MNVAYGTQSDLLQGDQKRSHKGIWLAIVIALMLHFFFVLLPLIDQKKPRPVQSNNIEVQVSRYTPEAVPELPIEAERPAEPIESVEVQQKPPVTQVSQKSPKAAEEDVANSPEVRTPLPSPPSEQLAESSEQPLQRLAPGILSSQFISQESTADKIFGPALQQDPQPERKEFHFPQRPNMITMLDKPATDLPFAYTPGLVAFAYAPGVKGDFQRFFDKITPEFGWKSNYGTQYKCKWILVIAACGWGRIKDHVKSRTADVKPEQLEGGQ